MTTLARSRYRDFAESRGSESAQATATRLRYARAQPSYTRSAGSVPDSAC